MTEGSNRSEAVPPDPGSSSFSGLVVTRLAFEANPDMELPIGAGENHEVIVHISGPDTLGWRVGRQVRRTLMLPGHIIVNPAHYVEGRTWEKANEHLRVRIPTDSIYLGPEPVALRGEIGGVDPLLAQLALYLARTVEQGASADSLYADALAHALGAHLLEHYNDRPTPRPPAAGPSDLTRRQVERVCDYVESNIDLALSVRELAEVAGVSPTHFARLFRLHTGKTPHQYVRERRLERALQLVTGTRRPLASIATAVGFSDQSHLTRVMRSLLGVTPGELRRSAGPPRPNDERSDPDTIVIDARTYEWLRHYQPPPEGPPP